MTAAPAQAELTALPLAVVRMPTTERGLGQNSSREILKGERVNRFEKFVSTTKIAIALARLALLAMAVYILFHFVTSFQQMW